MKILHLTNTDLRVDNRILKELKAVYTIENSIAKGFGVFESQFSLQDNLDLEVQIENINLLIRHLSFLPKVLSLPFQLIEISIRFFLKGVIFRPEIIHCHDTMVLPVGVILSVLFNSKLIYDAHELESEKHNQSKFLGKSTLFIEKLAWKKIDLLISVSPSIIDWYQEHIGIKENLLILNSPALKMKNEVNYSDNYLREKFNISENCKIFIYIGILSDGRGIDLYLDVFQSPEITSHIVFLGDGKYEKKVKEATLNFNNIHYHPTVKADYIIDIAKSADVGLLLIKSSSLSYYYCLPNKLFEYVFSRLFILSSDYPELKQIIEEYELGVCIPPQFKDLRNKIIEIEGQLLRPSIKNLHSLSWEFQLNKLQKAYKQLIKK